MPRYKVRFRYGSTGLNQERIVTMEAPSKAAARRHVKEKWGSLVQSTPKVEEA